MLVREPRESTPRYSTDAYLRGHAQLRPDAPQILLTLPQMWAIIWAYNRTHEGASVALAIRHAPLIFDRSKLKNDYRGILDHAREDGAVLIRDEGAETLYIVRGSVYRHLVAAEIEAQDFAQLVFAMAQTSGAGPARPSPLSLGRLSWASDLSAESFQMFVSEYIESFFRAINRGDWEEHRRMVLAWRDTAAVERDPALLAQIMDRADAAANEDIPRPEPE